MQVLYLAFFIFVTLFKTLFNLQLWVEEIKKLKKEKFRKVHLAKADLLSLKKPLLKNLHNQL